MDPITNKELFLAAAAGDKVSLPTPVTREEIYLKRIAERSGGGSDSSQNANGLSSTASALLITILRNGVYSTDQSANITALETALGSSGDSGGGEEEPDEPVTPEKTLTSISAVYSGGSVAVGTAVTALTGIVVTAHYSDGSTATVTGYTLSGTIAEGENTITVTYESKTATFTVTGTAESTGREPIDAYTAYEWTDGSYPVWNNTYKEFQETTDAAMTSSEYISLEGVLKIEAAELSGKGLAQYGAAFYDADKKGIQSSGTSGYVRKDNATYPSPAEIPIPEGAAYVRFSGKIDVLTSDGTTKPLLKYYIYK